MVKKLEWETQTGVLYDLLNNYTLFQELKINENDIKEIRTSTYILKSLM